MKRLKIILFCGMAQFPLTNLSAQNDLKLGLSSGYTYSNLQANLSNLIKTNYKARYGFGVNLNAELNVWSTLFVSSGVSYLQKNYEYQRTDFFSGARVNYDNDFLSFPLLIGGYMFNDPHRDKGFWLKIAGGMYTDYWLSSKYSGTLPTPVLITESGLSYNTISGRYDWKQNENKRRRFNYGVQGQGEIGYSLNKIDLFASFIYQYGLLGITKKESIDDYKETIKSYQIALGIAYKF